MSSLLCSANFKTPKLYSGNSKSFLWFFLYKNCLFSGLQIQELDPRVKQMYEGVRDVLSKYRSGKIPKAFKIIPSLQNWEQILYVTGKKIFVNFYKYIHDTKYVKMKKRELHLPDYCP